MNKPPVSEVLSVTEGDPPSDPESAACPRPELTAAVPALTRELDDTRVGVGVGVMRWMRNIVSRHITIDPPNDDTFPDSSTVSDKAERESLDRSSRCCDDFRSGAAAAPRRGRAKWYAVLTSAWPIGCLLLTHDVSTAVAQKRVPLRSAYAPGGATKAAERRDATVRAHRGRL